MYCFNRDKRLVKHNDNGPVNNGKPSFNYMSELISPGKGRGYVLGLKRIKKADLEAQITFEFIKRVVPYLWVPGSETPDYMQKEQATSEENKLSLTAREAWDVYVGELDPCSTDQVVNILTGESLEGLFPLTKTFEELRRKYGHSYKEMCKTIEVNPANEKRIRKVLAFNGYGMDGELLVWLSRYLDIPDREKAIWKVVNLQKASLHKKELNGAPA